MNCFSGNIQIQYSRLLANRLTAHFLSIMDKFVKRVRLTTSADQATSSMEESEENQGPLSIVPCSNNSIIRGAPDISTSCADESSQPILQRYPPGMFGSRSRMFSSFWYQKFNWLEYSPLKDMAFCYCCRHFSVGHVPEIVFSKTGFNNWKKAIISFSKHANSDAHKLAAYAWTECKEKLLASTTPRIQSLLNEQHNKTVRENRDYIKALLITLRFTACQGIGQRGHIENSDSINKGNFFELLNCIAEFNPVIKKKIEDMPKNAKYTHHDIQNEMLNIMALSIMEIISQDIANAGVFSLMVDETKDISKKEQVSFVIRYLKNFEITEKFIAFKEADGLDAKSLMNLIKETLSKFSININNCIAQCYDGASVMSGSLSGVQTRFRQLVPQAIYIHCFAHRLNLALVDCVTGMQGVAEFFCHCSKNIQIFFWFRCSRLVPK